MEHTGGILPTIAWVFHDDVVHEKERLNPFFLATDADARRCVLPEGVLIGWNAVYAQWKAFYAEPVPEVWGLGNQWALTQQYAADLSEWQKKIRDAKCVLTSPDVRPTDDPRKGPDTRVSSTLQWLSAAAITVALVYAVKTLRR